MHFLCCATRFSAGQFLCFPCPSFAVHFRCRSFLILSSHFLCCAKHVDSKRFLCCSSLLCALPLPLHVLLCRCQATPGLSELCQRTSMPLVVFHCLCYATQTFAGAYLCFSVPCISFADRGNARQCRSLPLLHNSMQIADLPSRHVTKPSRTIAMPCRARRCHSLALFNFFPAESAFPTVSPLSDAGESPIV